MRKNLSIFVRSRGLIKSKYLLFAAALFLSQKINAQEHQFSWVKSIGSTSSEGGRNILTDASGNVYTSGTFSGTVDFDPGTAVVNLTSIGTTNMFVAKYDASGNLMWAKAIKSGSKICLDASGNLYVSCDLYEPTLDVDPGTGVSILTRMGTSDGYILKLDPSGNFVWAKQFGGDKDTKVNGICVDGLGNICITGDFSGTTDFDPGIGTATLTSLISGTSIFVAKLNSSGNYVWAKYLEGSSSSFSSGVYITTDLSGNIFSTGYIHETVDMDPGAGVVSLTSSGMSDIYLLKLDPLGNFSFAKRIGGTEPDWAYSLATDKVGNVYATGTVDGNADFDPDGAGYILSTGGTLGGPDVYLAKFNNSGKLLWAYIYGGGGAESSGGVAIDPEDNVYVAGAFVGVVDFDKSTTATAYLNSGTNINGFILKVDNSGSYKWVQQFATSGTLATSAVGNLAIDASFNLYSTGSYSGTVDFDASTTATKNIMSAGGADFFLHKSVLDKTSIYEQSTPSFTVFPNPVTEVLNLVCPQPVKDGVISITNIQGQVVFEKRNLNGKQFAFDVQDLVPGNYIIENKEQNFKKLFSIVR
jgi:hypothetical protein